MPGDTAHKPAKRKVYRANNTTQDTADCRPMKGDFAVLNVQAVASGLKRCLDNFHFVSKNCFVAKPAATGFHGESFSSILR